MAKLLASFISQLTTRQRARFVRLARTSDNHLTNLKGGASAGVALAARLEEASARLAREDATAPAPFTRAEVNATCARCPHAKG